MGTKLLENFHIPLRYTAKFLFFQRNTHQKGDFVPKSSLLSSKTKPTFEQNQALILQKT